MTTPTPIHHSLAYDAITAIICALALFLVLWCVRTALEKALEEEAIRRSLREQLRQSLITDHKRRINRGIGKYENRHHRTVTRHHQKEDGI